MTIFTVAAGRASFRHCTFEASSTAASLATAIAWRGPPRSARAAADWQGRLMLDGCTIRGFATAVQCPSAQRATLELTNTLLVGCGSVARLVRAPRGDEVCEVWLIHVTARETGPLVRIDYEELPAAIGQLTITAQESTLAPRRGEPLVLFAGPAAPEPLLAAMEWQGQGSLVTPETTIAACRFGDAALDPIADEDLAVAGLDPQSDRLCRRVAHGLRRFAHRPLARGVAIERAAWNRRARTVRRMAGAVFSAVYGRFDNSGG